jgi:hypothetical protein
MAMYPDLVKQFEFTHKYNSVKRFVRGLKNKDPRQYDPLGFLPAEKAQVSFGSCKPSHVRAGERYTETNRLCPERKQNLPNLLSQTCVSVNEIAFTWGKPRDIHVGARLIKSNRGIGIGTMATWSEYQDSWIRGNPMAHADWPSAKKPFCLCVLAKYLRHQDPKMAIGACSSRKEEATA